MLKALTVNVEVLSYIGKKRMKNNVHKYALLHCLVKTFCYTAFGMWWHTVTHGWGSEGETGEWRG